MSDIEAQEEIGGVANGWRLIDTAPKDADVLVYFNHEADPYQDPYDTNKLTSYAVWSEGGPFLDGCGVCVAKWHEQHWESDGEYGGGYWMPAWWFAKHDGEYEFVVNPTHWQPLPAPPIPQTQDKEASE